MAEPTTEQMQQQANMTAEALAKVLGNQRSSPTGGGGGSSSGGGATAAGSVKSADGIVAGLIGAFDKLRTGTGATTQAVEGFGSALGKIPLAGGALSSAFGTASGAVLQSADTHKQLALQGANFNGNLGQMATTIAKSGLTNEQFIKQTGEWGSRMTGVAGGQAEAMKQLVGFQNEFRASEMGQKLKDMGMGLQEIDKFSLTMLSNTTARDLKDKNARAEAVAATEALTKSVLSQNMATGQSIDSILKKTALDDSNMEVNTQLLLLGKDQQKAYENMLPHMQGLGKDITGLIQEQMSDIGVTSDKGQDTMNALGPALSGQLNEAVQAQKQAAATGRAEDKERADRMMIQARAAIDRQMQDPMMLRQAQMSMRGQDMGDNGAALRILQERLPNVRANIADQRVLQQAGRQGTTAEAKELQDERARRAVTQQDAQGQRNVGADTIAGANSANIAAQTEAQNLLAKGLVSAGKGLDAFGQRLLKMSGGGDGRPTPTPGQRVENQVPAGGTAVPRDPSRARAEGTEGVLGTKFEPKTDQLLIHKGENVLNPEDAKKYAAAGGSAGIEKLMSAIGSAKSVDPKSMAPSGSGGIDNKQLDGMMSNIKMPFNDKQISGMFDNIKMPASNINEKQMSSMMSSLTSGNTGVPMTKDLMGNIKSQVSSMGTEMSSAKTPPKPQALPDATNETEKPKSESDTTVFNTDVLTALNSLNKMMGELVSHSQTGNEIADSMTRKIGSSNRFEG